MELDIMQGQYHRQTVEMSPQMSYRMWRDAPMSHIQDSEALKHVSALGGSDYGSLNIVWKDMRRQMLKGKPGRSVHIGVVGLSVSGKSEIAQGLAYMVENDFYLKTEAKRRGFEVVPVTMPFALGAKAMQLPRERGGPGLIRADAGHGKFTSEEYAQIAEGIKAEVDQSIANPTPGQVRVHIMEASGLPYPHQEGKRVGVEGMADRGVSPIYRLPFDPEQAKNTFILLMAPNRAIQEFGLTERVFNPYASNQRELVSGRVVYQITGEDGTVKDVAELSAKQQSDVAKLLLLSTAPQAAVERSNKEFVDMKNQFVDDGILTDSSNETYMKALRERLLHNANGKSSNIPGEQVIILESKFWSDYRNASSNIRNLDYLLRMCRWSKKYPKLIPPSLRGFLGD